MKIQKWFILKNNHYQVLPHIGWTTEVYQMMEDCTHNKTRWCYNWGISFAWLSLSTGFRLCGYLT